MMSVMSFVLQNKNMKVFFFLIIQILKMTVKIQDLVLQAKQLYIKLHRLL